MIESIVHDFINLISDIPNPTNERNLYSKLLDINVGDGNKLMEYVRQYPHVLVMILDSSRSSFNLVFDYFYDRVLHKKVHPMYDRKWLDNLLEIIDILTCLGSMGEMIKDNKKYLLNLQIGCHSNHILFEKLYFSDFEIGDHEFLVYSLIARGELDKLKTLSDNFVIEDYAAVLDVGLRFGRYEILEYFVENLNLEINLYGKIVDFENYIDNSRYVYYRDRLHYDSNDDHSPPITTSKQDYVKSLQIILRDYEYPITVNTLDIWCNVINNKRYTWDIVNYEVMRILKSIMTDPIPMTHDFGCFNDIIFGQDWSNRSSLVTQCMSLQDKLFTLQQRYDKLENMYHKIYQDNDTLRYKISAVRPSRIRRDTD